MTIQKSVLDERKLTFTEVTIDSVQPPEGTPIATTEVSQSCLQYYIFVQPATIFPFSLLQPEGDNFFCSSKVFLLEGTGEGQPQQCPEDFPWFVFFSIGHFSISYFSVL